MDDLGQALAEGGKYMLGGGNPARIPAMLEIFRRELQAVVDDDRQLVRMLADYAEPAGEPRFRESLAGLFRREYGWDIGPQNVVVTSGSQTGFFQLFNLLAGTTQDGGQRRILLPVTPEYTGYEDLSVGGDLFASRRPEIELLEGNLFKYRVDFQGLEISDDISAICVSRPTNPTGNVLSDEEMAQLESLAAEKGIPLIVDNAYGLPFPRMVYAPCTVNWNPDIILCMSLSKLGLPAVRTGVILAREEITDAITGMNSVMSLSVGSVGPVLVNRLVKSGEIVDLSEQIIRPFYQQRAEQALAWAQETLDGCPYRIHVPEGAFFLWLWLPDLPISSRELYQRLKARNVLVLSGHYFFPGLDDDWAHQHECLRVNYCQDDETVREGLRIIGEEVRRAFQGQ